MGGGMAKRERPVSSSRCSVEQARHVQAGPDLRVDRGALLLAVAGPGADLRERHRVDADAPAVVLRLLAGEPSGTRQEKEDHLGALAGRAGAAAERREGVRRVAGLLGELTPRRVRRVLRALVSDEAGGQ